MRLAALLVAEKLRSFRAASKGASLITVAIFTAPAVAWNE